MNDQTETEDGGVEILVVEDSPTQAEQPGGKRLSGFASQKREGSARSDQQSEADDCCQRHHDARNGWLPTLRRIKGDKKLKDILVILLTSLSDPADVMKGLECGSDDFITKPYNENYLLSRIQHILINR